MPISTVAEYLATLPADRRAAASAVREAINENLAPGYEEGMQFGMIGWYVPPALYPAGYGGKSNVPLPLIGLASQKSGLVLHCIGLYMNPDLSAWFVDEYQKTGKKLDMGKGCVRFKSLDDLPLDVIGRLVARVPVEKHMANYQASISKTKSARRCRRSNISPLPPATCILLPRVNPRQFFAELKRRNVYRVAVAYAVASWLLIQIATQVFPFFEVPNWAVRVVVLLLVLGFPVALILAWAFDLTPEGIKRTEDLEVAPEQPHTRHAGRKFLALVAVGGALALALLIVRISLQSDLKAQEDAASDSRLGASRKSRSPFCPLKTSAKIKRTASSPRACRMKS